MTTGLPPTAQIRLATLLNSALAGKTATEDYTEPAVQAVCDGLWNAEQRLYQAQSNLTKRRKANPNYDPRQDGNAIADDAFAAIIQLPVTAQLRCAELLRDALGSIDETKAQFVPNEHDSNDSNRA